MKKILVVDDQPGMRLLLEHALAEGGFQVVTANDGREALKKLTEEKFHIVLLDMKMPGMSGLEVLANLQDAKLSSQFVMMTAYREDLLAEQAKQLGVQHFLTKPFNIEEMLEMISRLVSEAMPAERLCSSC
ncbi:MAG: response regulator [Bacillota bacterium]|nr:response regulator [Bacillota bacterium]